MKKGRVAFALMLFLSICFCGCKQKESYETLQDDFESLMGKGLPQWKYVQTLDDYANLAYFKELYDQNISLLDVASEEIKIPKILHWVWIGSKPFPRESVDYVRSWVGKHPDWTCYLWTDRPRPLPHSQLKIRMVNELKWSDPKLREHYENSDNFGEKSDLLRLEIIDQEGGVYVDHDVKCLKAFDPFHHAFDLYCGMEMPYKTSLESSIFPTNNTLGARAGHPILKRCKEWLVENWDAIEKAYPGKDRDAILNRIAHRTFYVLGKVMRERANQEGFRDIALPTLYFNAPKDELALFARHMYAGTWFENETAFEKGTRERLMYLSKKANRALLYVGLSAAVNVLCFALLALLIVKKNKR